MVLRKICKWETAANDAVKNYGAFESKYQTQLDDIYNKIMNRKDFNYDLKKDFWRQYEKVHIFRQYKECFNLGNRKSKHFGCGRNSFNTCKNYHNNNYQKVKLYGLNYQHENGSTVFKLCVAGGKAA